MHNDLRAFRGIAFSAVAGVFMWVVIILLILLIADVVSAQPSTRNTTNTKCPPLMLNCRRLSEEEKRKITEEAERESIEELKTAEEEGESATRSKKNARPDALTALLIFLRIDGNPVAALALLVCVVFTILAIAKAVKRKRGNPLEPLYQEQRQIALDAIALAENYEQQLKAYQSQQGQRR